LTEPDDVKQRISELLKRWSEGDTGALDALVPLVYADVRRIAGYLFKKERKNHTLGPTAVVHEAFMKFRHANQVTCRDGAHFLAIYARAMRQILIDYSDYKNAQKRHGEEVPLEEVPLHELHLLCRGHRPDLLVLKDAIERLAQTHPRWASVVDLRVFCGFDNSQVAEMLKVSPNTVIRDWKEASKWLRHEIKSKGAGRNAS